MAAAKTGSSGIEIICRSVEELAEPVRVQGATVAARALIVSRLYKDSLKKGLRSPIVAVCADDETATEFASDLEALASCVDQLELAVGQFSGWEQSPYSSIAPSIRTRLARMAALSRLVSPASEPASGSGAGLPVIVTTIAALSQAGMPREHFERYSVAIRVEESAGSREALMRRLAEAGYLQVDPVEDPGTFAARGDIVDVFPPDREHPIRIELFDDVVERIRKFDSATQRTLPESSQLRGLVIPPAREVLVNPETVSRLREQVKARADDVGVSRAVRDPVLASVHPGSYPDHSDAWAAFAYEKPGCLMDYLPDGARVVWVDELSCLQGWDEYLEEQKELSSRQAEPGRAQLILPPVDRVFLWNETIERRVREKSRLYLDRITLADLESVPAAEKAGNEEEPNPRPHAVVSTRHQIFCKGNTELARGSRHALGELEPQFKLWQRQGFKILALASTQSQLERIRFLLEERGFACHPELPPTPGVISLRIGAVSEGFRWPAEGLVLLTEGEILGSRPKRRKSRQTTAESGSAARDWSGLQALSDLSVGDAVVHVDHGIGRYQGLVRLSLSGAPSDFLLLEYAGKDRLYLPVYRLNVIEKYVGSGESVQLDKLGSQQFAKAKEKVREAVRRLAIDLVRLYAERKVRPGMAFAPPDALYREFESSFPFDETPDQLKAIEQVQGDLESGQTMDRLVCGDVGYGKTEVAIRAAFQAVSNGKQVAVLVPTTVLAFQHEQNFRARLKDYPIQIESVSRFKGPREQKRILGELSSGKIDILIGTHRLLSRDIRFNDLGLVIVDEEHRFGVEHKEKLKTLKVNTHVLTLTATPIPRTLHMALSGLRDISLINTPPVDRQPIRTYVSKYDEALMQRAIEFELSRGGQVFLLHNRVQSIYEMANTIRTLCPQALVGVGHGQMPEGELEETMMAFYQKRVNVLVCTTIIESGLDIPSANTIIMNRADSLGLAQLYQIRGRVGRGQNRAYAYLLIPAETAVTDDAKRRLEVIQRFVELGSGFSIASHDLEIRGGGNLLGAQQSGHIAAVGFDLYTELLEEAIRELHGKGAETGATEAPQREPEIKAPFPAYLGEEYVPDIHQRLSLYRRFSAAGSDTEIDRLEEELRDRFGPLPAEAQNLLWMIRIKLLLKKMGVDTLTVGPERVSITTGPGTKLDPAKVISLMASRPADYQLTPDSKFVARLATTSLRDLFFALEGLFKNVGPTFW